MIERVERYAQFKEVLFRNSNGCSVIQPTASIHRRRLHDILFVQRQGFDLVNADISGNIASQFSNYTTEANRQLVMASFQNSPFTKHIPVSALEEIAKHPESSSCRHLAGNSAKVNATTTSTQK